MNLEAKQSWFLEFRVNIRIDMNFEREKDFN
jgi:hypothetical protein